MKKILFLSFALVFATSVAFGANFAPTLLKISAPTQVQYNFDGKDLTIPVKITGTAASVNLCVFTKDQASKVSKIRNGFLGWHYVNKVDTCLYVSKSSQLPIGSSNLSWNGKDKNGVLVPKGTYTYYIWAFDNVSVKTRASKYIQTYAHNMYLRIQQKNTDGKPLANPFVYRSRTSMRWTLGNDPMDTTFVQTTKVTLPATMTEAMFPAVQADNFSMVFINLGNKDTSTHAIAKYKWVPNGEAVLQTGWANNGLAKTTASWWGGNSDAGVETDGAYLYTVTGSHYTTVPESDFRIWDLDGSVISKIDISPWWSSLEAKDKGGQLNGGPNTLSSHNGLVYLNCHCSCWAQVVNPIAALENEGDLVVWTNGNGDSFLDHNYTGQVGVKVPWMCNDYNVGPYKYTFEADANGFSFIPCYDEGAVSFGALAPDGTGIGYCAFVGETAGLKYGQYFVDNGSQFDGIYCDNNNSAVAADKGGFWFVGQDSFKGVLSYQIGVAEAPEAFSVAQNTPNPFNPTTTINFALAKAGKVTIDVYNTAGQRVDTIVNANMSAGDHSVTWNASRFAAGVYFYTVKTGEFSKTMKMTLLK